MRRTRVTYNRSHTTRNCLPPGAARPSSRLRSSIGGLGEVMSVKNIELLERTSAKYLAVIRVHKVTEQRTTVTQSVRWPSRDILLSGLGPYLPPHMFRGFERPPCTFPTKLLTEYASIHREHDMALLCILDSYPSANYRHRRHRSTRLSTPHHICPVAPPHPDDLIRQHLLPRSQRTSAR